MLIVISDTREETGRRAGREAARRIRSALAERGEANIILATGMSQFDMLKTLVAAVGIDWARVTMFHLDEYIGIPATHPASFRRYLRERFVDRVGRLAETFFVDGEAPDPAAECHRLGDAIGRHPIDVALVGIGENGHLAFNDPPANFDTDEPYIVVELDEACRRQQLGEGWFPTLEDVPRRAVSMSIRQIMKSAAIIATVPDERKATAVKHTLEDPVSLDIPASILRNHPDCTLYLDRASASLLTASGAAAE